MSDGITDAEREGKVYTNEPQPSLNWRRNDTGIGIAEKAGGKMTREDFEADVIRQHKDDKVFSHSDYQGAILLLWPHIESALKDVEQQAEDKGFEKGIKRAFNILSSELRT